MLSTQADKLMIFVSLQVGSSVEMAWLKYSGLVTSFKGSFKTSHQATIFGCVISMEEPACRLDFHWLSVLIESHGSAYADEGNLWYFHSRPQLFTGS